MTDDAFLRALEDGSLALTDFSHRAHVRAGYLMLKEEPTFGRALDRLANAIRAFAARHGKDGLYHETITVAFMSLIAARKAANDPGDWETFAAAHPDLFEKDILARYYTPDLLRTRRARAVFLLPGEAA